MKYLKLLIALLVFASSLVYINIRSADFRKNPFNVNLKFNSPYRAFADCQGNKYLIDNDLNGYKRLHKISSDGKVVFSLNSGKRGEGKLYSFYKISVADNGIVYINNMVFNIKTQFPEKCEIVAFSPDGSYLSTPVRYVYDEAAQQKINAEYISSAHLIPFTSITGNVLNYFYFDGPSELGLYEYDLQSGLSKKTLSVNLPAALSDITGTEPGRIFFTLLDGSIFRVNEKGKSERISAVNSAKFGNIYPYPLSVDSRGNLLFNEMFSQRIISLSGGIFSEYYDYRKILTDKYPGYCGLVSFYQFCQGHLIFSDRVSGKLYDIDVQKSNVTVVEKANLLKKDVFAHLLYWVVVLLGIFSFLFIMFSCYVIILKKRFPLAVKLIVMFGSILVISVYVISMHVFDKAQVQTNSEREKRYLLLSQVAANAIDGNTVEKLNSLKDVSSEDYVKLCDTMKKLVNQNEDEWNNEISFYIYKKIGNVYCLVDMNGYDFLYPYPLPQSYNETLETGKIKTNRYSDENGNWITATAPVKNKLGKIVGIVEIGASLETQNEMKRNIRVSVLKNILLAMIAFGLVLGVFVYYILKSIRKLRSFSEQVANKNYEVEIDINSRDEIEELGNSFNMMVREIKGNVAEIRQYADRVERLKNANARFVPMEMLSHLEKTSIADVRLGDQVIRNMTIMFTDIRNFTTLSEKMTPQENFNFLNSFLNRFGPLVRENGGFVDKYIGDCIMALFPNSVDDAIRSAILMRRSLKEYNSHRGKSGYDPISIGIGLHIGSMMLGIIGEKERFEGTVISDSVNLGSRLESLTKLYSVGILVSSNVIVDAKNIDSYHYRFIDYVKVKGKNEPVLIYEIYDEDEDDQVILKDSTKDRLVDAIHLIIKGSVLEAKEIFVQIKQENPHDGVVDVYLRRCEDFSKGSSDYDFLDPVV